MPFFKNVPIEISKFGIGTWQLGGPTSWNGKQTGWGKMEEEKAVELLNYAISKGINFIDTSDGYGKGRSETIIGKALQTVDSEQVVICTKFGSKEDLHGNYITDFSEQWLLKSVRESLLRLQIETIDILLLHSPPSDFDWNSYSSAPFEKLIQEGKIKTYGVSVRNRHDAIKVIKAGFGNVIEGTYNILDRRMEDEVLPLCLKHNYSFIARSVLAHGFLKDEVSSSFKSDDFRSAFPDEQNSWIANQVIKLKQEKQFKGRISQLAMRYAASCLAVQSVIVGVKNKAQIDALLEAQNLGQLDSEDIGLINQLIPEVYEKWK